MIYSPGTKLKIVRCKNYPGLIGRIVTVDTYQDCPDKIKVSFDEQWQGYFTPTQLCEIDDNFKND